MRAVKLLFIWKQCSTHIAQQIYYPHICHIAFAKYWIVPNKMRERSAWKKSFICAVCNLLHERVHMTCLRTCAVPWSSSFLTESLVCLKTQPEINIAAQERSGCTKMAGGLSTRRTRRLCLVAAWSTCPWSNATQDLLPLSWCMAWNARLRKRQRRTYST
jgi:hypothetical protein